MMATSLTSSLYKLSRQLIGHTDEIRSLAVFKDGSIISASRDKTSRYWRIKEGDYAESIVMTGHSDIVCSVCAIEPTQKNPTGFIITGSNDAAVCIYYPGEEKPIHVIKAHENTVCSLRASAIETESFFSSSKDNTGKLWNLYDLKQPESIFLGHTPNTIIWCILDLLNGSVITGGSDKAVIVHLRSGRILHKLIGHSGCIRDIAAVNENEFLTCGNDALTKHWNAISGECLGSYSGHTSHIYSISAIFGGSLAVSCGEDKTVKIWRNAQVDQTIVIPAESLWSIELLPNEDIVCGSSDGVVRIFTTNSQRYIDKESMKTFETAVLESIKKCTQRNFNDTDITKLPCASELNEPGEKDGDTIIVKDGVVKAYRWSQKKYQWELIGDVIENENEHSGKQMFNGLQYDYVFSVDIEEGAPLLKLPYNNGEDPYIVAQKFIEDNNLRPRYLNRVANFIITNLQINPILKAEAQYKDPFAGGSRYISNSVQENVDQVSATSASNSLVLTTYIPQSYYLKFERGNVTAIFEKLKEFNAKGEENIQSIDNNSIESLRKLINGECNTSIIDEISILKSILTWPDRIVFPVLDIARLAVLQKNVNEQLCTNEISFLLKKHMQNEALTCNQMLIFRLLTNMFLHETGEKFCLQCRNEVLTAMDNFSNLGNKNNEVAMTTYILNLILALNKTNDFLGKLQAMNVILKLLGILKDTEAIFRILVALGTLIVGASDDTEQQGFVKAVKQCRHVLQALRILLDDVESSNVPNKLLSVTKQIIELIKM